MIKFATAVLISFLTTLITTLPSRADESFHTSISIDYSYSTDGTARVKQDITLINKKSELYATTYILNLKGEDPQNIQASDANGPLRLTSTKNPGGTQIAIYIESPALGKNKSTSFTITYIGKPAIKNGQVWEILTPRLVSDEFADDYNIKISIPKSFGNPAYISPNPKSHQFNSATNRTEYSFDKQTLSDSAISAAFGNLQAYDFSLKYVLKNTTDKSGTFDIAIPPDHLFQQVFYRAIDPPPVGVEVDTDGNWLAKYHLKARESQVISMSGQIHLFPKDSGLFVSSIPENLSLYTKPDKYWPSDSKVFRDLASGKTPRQIYDLVVKTLSYDSSRITNNPNRRGAELAFKDPNHSLCTDFTDLFVTLSRAAGIPAREINGYALTTDPVLMPVGFSKVLLHSWPEYWNQDTNSWVQVDPTWSKTNYGIDYFSKLDFSHISFVIHGSDSSRPVSPGLSPIVSAPSEKSVEVSIAEYENFDTVAPEVSWERGSLFLPFLSPKLHLIIRNIGPAALYKTNIHFASNSLPLASNPIASVPVLPPYQTTKIPIIFKPSLLPPLAHRVITAKIGDRELNYNIPDSYFIYWYVATAIIIVVFFVGLAILAHFAWSLYIQKLQRNHPLHR